MVYHLHRIPECFAHLDPTELYHVNNDDYNKKVQYKQKSTLTFPSIAESAELADSSLEKLTNPNPLDLPLSLSVITFAVKQTQTRQSFFKAAVKSHQSLLMFIPVLSIINQEIFP